MHKLNLNIKIKTKSDNLIIKLSSYASMKLIFDLSMFTASFRVKTDFLDKYKFKKSKNGNFNLDYEFTVNNKMNIKILLMNLIKILDKKNVKLIRFIDNDGIKKTFNSELISYFDYLELSNIKIKNKIKHQNRNI